MAHIKRHTRHHRARRHRHSLNSNDHQDDSPRPIPVHNAANPTKSVYNPPPSTAPHIPPALTSASTSASAPATPWPPVHITTTTTAHPPLAPRSLNFPLSYSLTLKLGIAFALAGVTAVLAALIFCCFRRMKRRRAKKKAMAAQSGSRHDWGNLEYYIRNDAGVGRR